MSLVLGMAKNAHFLTTKSAYNNIWHNISKVFIGQKKGF